MYERVMFVTRPFSVHWEFPKHSFIGIAVMGTLFILKNDTYSQSKVSIYISTNKHPHKQTDYVRRQSRDLFKIDIYNIYIYINFKKVTRLPSYVVRLFVWMFVCLYVSLYVSSSLSIVRYGQLLRCADKRFT